MAASPIKNAQNDAAQKMFEDAAAMQRQGNHKGAIKRFKRLLKQAPEHPQLLNMCALSLAETGDMRNAEKLLERAAKADPENGERWGNLGMFLRQNGKLEAAAEAFEKYRRLSSDAPAAHLSFADACHDLERFADALPAYEKAVGLGADTFLAWRNISRCHMFEGNWQQGLDAADNALAKDPGNSLLLAVKSVALSELGRDRQAAELVDFDRLVAPMDLAAPEGFADMAAFNDAVCAHSLAHPSLEYEPKGKSTQRGHQSTNLAEGDQGPIAPLLAMIEEAVGDYCESHALDPSHEFLAQRPDGWDIYIWATVLDSQGHQAAHLHPSGWLSGVYYARVPGIVAANPDSEDGWIEFGRAAKYPRAKAEHPVKTYQPREGRVVLFPSYFYHRTIPFASDEQRISIAFDLIPRS
ncbi:MAG: putative 2OG-Fe(II) oxygenase [Hyphomicrobiaceae bacterium]|nr:putative 2OG-Fe(II) oxygenase [Hyphomicrobiaceae bacterium]